MESVGQLLVSTPCPWAGLRLKTKTLTFPGNWAAAWQEGPLGKVPGKGSIFLLFTVRLSYCIFLEKDLISLGILLIVKLSACGRLLCWAA